MKKVKKKIHFLGIKGVGMAPLAIIAKEAGFIVSGCDIAEKFITDFSLEKAGIKPLVDFSEKHLENIDLLVTTAAHGGFNNSEVIKAGEKGIKVISQGEAVGLFMKGEIFDHPFDGISVAGCHGKTTTTAMLATILIESGLDPSFLVGTADISSLSNCGHFGKGKYFIAEADEYDRKFLNQNPKIAIFNNIEFDHPDSYKSIGEVKDAFFEFSEKISKDGLLIANGDDEEVKKIIKGYSSRVITFGKSPQNDFILKDPRISGSRTFFWVETKDGASLGEFSLNVVGEHNALNALGAIICSLEIGVGLELVKKSLLKFKGTKRRFEYVGKLSSGALLFDDYAHHPTEIQKTLQAFRQSFPKSRIVCVFQPHMYSRTKILFDQFIHSFSDANIAIITNIYPSMREKADPNFSTELLIKEMKFFHKGAMFLPQPSNVIEYLTQKQFPSDTVIITMGAGDIYKISEELEVK